MFTDFEKAFFQKNEKDVRIPKEIVKSLSETLPEGFTYTNIGNGAIGVVPLGTEAELSGLELELPDDLPGNFKPSTYQELKEFMYRIQRPIKIKLKDDSVILNGTTIKLDKLIQRPLEPVDPSGYEISLVPQPFQPPFEIKLQGNGITKKLFVQRQPYAHMHKSLFKSINNSNFEISYIIDETNELLTFNFKYNLENIDNIEEGIAILELYQSCIEGGIKLNNLRLPEAPATSIEKETIPETINFWKKVLTLQEHLGVQFIPEFKTKREDVILVEEIYRSLIETRPFKKYLNINDLTLTGPQGMDLKELVGREELSIQFHEYLEVSLFGVKLNLISVVAFFDFMVKGIKSIKDDVPKHILITESIKGKRTYQVARHFRDKETASSYMEYIQKNIKEFEDAEELKVKY
ncbi:abortive infection system toxin AbiGii family protein [Priestia megaterium]|uniref:abortive infection system toxin AbiGii family protein n=1 Tax=Priestia megaterium TaxID=1404 RepID=UPI002A6B2874|nr:abortive infection system toxin AbiGii family protein [Priestia megaterium]MDY0943643.1 abortive infection system toxin AbiGii family protein [Priestia megaterium]